MAAKVVELKLKFKEVGIKSGSCPAIGGNVDGYVYVKPKLPLISEIGALGSKPEAVKPYFPEITVSAKVGEIASNNVKTAVTAKMLALREYLPISNHPNE